MATLAQRLESALLPLPDTLEWREGQIIKREWTTIQKVEMIAEQVLAFVANIVLLPIAIAISLISRVFSLMNPAPEKPPEKEGAAIPQVGLAQILPQDFGFADSLFQTSGLGNFRVSHAVKWPLELGQNAQPRKYRRTF